VDAWLRTRAGAGRLCEPIGNTWTAALSRLAGLTGADQVPTDCWMLLYEEITVPSRVPAPRGAFGSHVFLVDCADALVRRHSAAVRAGDDISNHWQSSTLWVSWRAR